MESPSTVGGLKVNYFPVPQKITPAEKSRQRWDLPPPRFYVFLGVLGLYMPKIGNKRAPQSRFLQFYGSALKSGKWDEKTSKMRRGASPAMKSPLEGELTPSSIFKWCLVAGGYPSERGMQHSYFFALLHSPGSYFYKSKK